jgi:hypothetical protein
MQGFAVEVTRTALHDGVRAALSMPDLGTDCRGALCRFEDDLFAEFPAGHEIISHSEAVRMIAEVFGAVGRPAPDLELVPGFDDPKIGGFADVARNRIAIERGFLYRFLVLHECAHILVPEDRHHGAAFTYILQLLYRRFIGIPEAGIRRHLERHDLPSVTALPSRPAEELALAG